MYNDNVSATFTIEVILALVELFYAFTSAHGNLILYVLALALFTIRLFAASLQHDRLCIAATTINETIIVAVNSGTNPEVYLTGLAIIILRLLKFLGDSSNDRPH